MKERLINMAGKVPKLPLDYKPKNIRNFEDKYGSIFDNLDGSVTNITRLIQAGNGDCDEDTADNILCTFIENGGDVFEALMQIVEALQRGGFLPRDKALAKTLRKRFEKTIEDMVKDAESEIATTQLEA